MSGQEQGLVAPRRQTLPGEPASTSAARALVRDALEAAGRPEWSEAAELACSEIVTNAVLHAHTSIELTVEVHADHVRVAVRDFSPALPVQRHYDVSATTGRGMALVAALTDDHGVSDVGPDGKTVWFTVSGASAELADADLLATWGDADWDLDELLTADAHGATTEHAHTVTLLQMPPMLWLAARQHHDAIIRELNLHLAEHPDRSVDVASADRARAVISTAVAAAVEHAQAAGAVRQVLPQGHPSPLPEVPESLDLELTIPTELGPAFAVMQDTLDTAEQLAQAGQLLVRPGLPEIIAVRDWACEQVTAQLAGVAATAWPGTDEEHFTREVHGRHDDATLSGWDVTAVRDADRGVVAADESNRILAVSRPLADFLGWDPDELVGRRVVTLIPPHLREAHVAGFTRHLTTGEAHVLDVPLVLPVLHRDGSQPQADFLVQRAPASDGRAVYLAWIGPAAGHLDASG
jgi:PAS domain S-box-containing protein